MDFSNIRILVIGDVMLDQYILGDVKRISPEAPIPVVKKTNSWSAPGGAANVARNLGRLGVQARLVGLAGNDLAAQNLKVDLQKEKILDGIIYSRNRSTTCKTRILSRGQQLLRLDEEIIASPEPSENIELHRVIKELISGCNAVILSDYAKGTLLPARHFGSICTITISLARTSGIPVIIDPKGNNWDRYRGAQCITPNTEEFSIICGKNCDEITDIGKLAELADDVLAKFDVERILLTRGQLGMILFEKESRPMLITADKREVADVSGAGDTVISTLAACRASGLSWSESTRIANMAAGIVVEKLGTSPVTIRELNFAINERKDNPKLCSLAELSEKIKYWRDDGDSIVFTNGCFDLLHPGHISLIQQSSARGDRLVVGLNSDSSVRRLKGAKRPIQDETSRALLVGALKDVDAVIIFGEDTPLELIKEIRPDVLVKGSDYSIDRVIGAEFVNSYGGIVYLADFVPNCSTTELTRRMSS